MLQVTKQQIAAIEKNFNCVQDDAKTLENAQERWPDHFVLARRNEEHHWGITLFHRAELPILCVVFGQYASNSQDRVQGGAIAALLDVSQFLLSLSRGRRAVTAYLTTSYRRPVPLHKPVVIISSVKETEGRKMFIETRMTDLEGRLYATGDGLFIEPKM